MFLLLIGIRVIVFVVSTLFSVKSLDIIGISRCVVSYGFESLSMTLRAIYEMLMACGCQALIGQHWIAVQKIVKK